MMQVYKNKWLFFSVLVFGMVLFFGVNVDEQKLVVVIVIVEYLVLDVVCDGVKEVFQEVGYEDGKNFKWQYQSVQGNIGIVVQIVCKFIGDKFDVIVGIVILLVQVLVVVIKSILIVFSIVIDLVGVYLMLSWEVFGINVIGVFDMFVLDKQIELIKKVVLGVKCIGMVYNLGEVNFVVVVKELKELLLKMGLSLVEVLVLCLVDVSLVVCSLVGKVDVIYINIDNNVVFVYEVLVKVGNDVKILLIVFDIDSVKCGVIVVFGINYKEMGKQIGCMVVCIFKGEKLGEIKLEISDNLQLFVNFGVVQK